MKRIPLTQGQFALVDEADYEWLNQWKWFAYKHRHTFYAQRQSKKIAGKQTRIHMHIEIIGRKEGLMVDHVNGNGIDNQRHNLRHVTNRQNSQNKHTPKSSKYPGVSWDTNRAKWFACIRVNDKTKSLGRFTSDKEAAEAYVIAVNAL